MSFASVLTYLPAGDFLTTYHIAPTVDSQLADSQSQIYFTPVGLPPPVYSGADRTENTVPLLLFPIVASKTCFFCEAVTQ
jgi:hypothetical protein